MDLTREYTIKIMRVDGTGKWATEAQPIVSNCNCITFKNKGDTPVYIGNAAFPLEENDELVIPGEAGETDTTIYTVKFGATVNTKQLFIFRKVYPEQAKLYGQAQATPTT